MDMMPTRYTAYDLKIDSEISLPELNRIGTDATAPDVTVRKGDAARERLEGGEEWGPYYSFSPDGFWMHIPDVGRYLVEKGRTIVVEPEPGADSDSVRLFLLGSALGVLLFQRGYLVLHGNAIRIGDRCLVCVGESGAGKSSLAAGFMQRGFDILADDVVPVDSAARAIPGFPRIKLWQDVAERLNIDTTRLRRIRPDLNKFNVPLVSRADTGPIPIGWIYVIGKAPIEEIEVEYIRGMERFETLHENTYRVQYLDRMNLKSQHMLGCGNLADKIHLARVTRPEEGFNLDSLMDSILSDIARHEPSPGARPALTG